MTPRNTKPQSAEPPQTPMREGFSRSFPATPGKGYEQAAYIAHGLTPEEAEENAYNGYQEFKNDYAKGRISKSDADSDADSDSDADPDADPDADSDAVPATNPLPRFDHGDSSRVITPRRIKFPETSADRETFADPDVEIIKHGLPNLDEIPMPRGFDPEFHHNNSSPVCRAGYSDGADKNVEIMHETPERSSCSMGSDHTPDKTSAVPVRCMHDVGKDEKGQPRRW